MVTALERRAQLEAELEQWDRFILLALTRQNETGEPEPVQVTITGAGSTSHGFMTLRQMQMARDEVEARLASMKGPSFVRGILRRMRRW